MLIALLLPLQIVGLHFLKLIPGFVEQFYSLGLYPLLGKISRYIFGWIPFSMGDLFYILLIVLAIRWCIKNFKRFIVSPLAIITEILATLSIVYFMFHFLWGFNYYREPLHKALAIEADYTTETLMKVTKKLIVKSNELHNKLGFADSTKIDLPYTQQEMFVSSKNGFDNLKKQFPHLALSPQSIKKSTSSLGLTYMGYSGYLNPFSGEAHVNGLIKTYKFPVVSSHEQAHQLGYAKENEANFIATLATVSNDDPFIQYTGYIFALRFCLTELGRRDMQLYEEVRPTIHYGIIKSYLEMSQFWDSYNNPFEDVSKLFYNRFLQANNQPDGIKTYSYMVALVVNYFEEKTL